MTLTRICVFTGSSPGRLPAYRAAASELGSLLAKRDIELVYGGGKVGLMGITADAVLAAGGRAIGVIPEALLAREVAHRGLTELRVVASMHERKQLMADLADGFVAMPGGLGTFEELFEILTWAQLGLHAKPCGILNVADYYRPLLSLLDHAVQERFVRPDHRGILLDDSSPQELLAALAAYRAPSVDKWIDRAST